MVTGPDQKPPPHPFYGEYSERGKDPFHRDAFAGIPGVQEAIDEGRVINIGVDPASLTGKRREGWFLLDAWENTIGFIPDGTFYPDKTTGGAATPESDDTNETAALPPDHEERIGHGPENQALPERA